MIVIVDASVTISWIAEDERNDYAAATLIAIAQDFAVVPAIWQWELANVLLMLERRNRLTNASATWLKVMRLPIDTDYDRKDQNRAILELELARKHNLSVYDAAYLALAKATAQPLATLDAKLATAARKERLLFEPQ